MWYELCEEVRFFFPLLVVTHLAGKTGFCDCKEVSVKGLVEGKHSEGEGERPRQALFSIESQYSCGA